MRRPTGRPSMRRSSACCMRSEIDRILFSVDYPYSDNRACKRFLENLPISPDDKEKVAHLNAERLLKFKPPR